MVLVCNLSSIRDQFFMNPDVYHDTPHLAGEFSYQKEIISVDGFPLVGAAFVRHDGYGGDDKKILAKLVEIARTK